MTGACGLASEHALGALYDGDPASPPGLQEAAELRAPRIHDAVPNSDLPVARPVILGPPIPREVGTAMSSLAAVFDGRKNENVHGLSVHGAPSSTTTSPASVNLQSSRTYLMGGTELLGDFGERVQCKIAALGKHGMLAATSARAPNWNAPARSL